MSYEEWLNNIELLNNKDDLNVLKTLEQAPYNANINELLLPKLKLLIDNKLIKSINNIIKNLDFMYNDTNYMDICMIEFKKNISFIEKLIKLKQIPATDQQELINKLKNERNKTYEILEKESIAIDDKGILQMIIRNNRIKWSDQ